MPVRHPAHSCDISTKKSDMLNHTSSKPVYLRPTVPSAANNAEIRTFNNPLTITTLCLISSPPHLLTFPIQPSHLPDSHPLTFPKSLSHPPKEPVPARQRACNVSQKMLSYTSVSTHLSSKGAFRTISKRLTRHLIHILIITHRRKKKAADAKNQYPEDKLQQIF